MNISDKKKELYIGIAGRAPAGTTLYYIYVSAKDYETASALLFNGKKNI